MTPSTRDAKKHAKARKRRYLKAQERLERDCRQAQHAAKVLEQALEDLCLPTDLVAEIEGRLRRQQSTRSGSENRNHAAACDSSVPAGSRDGGASPRKAALCAATRYAKTLRFCCFSVATTVI